VPFEVAGTAISAVPATPYVMPSRASASCTSSRALWMRGERDLEGVGDLRVGQADDVAEQQRHLEIGVEVVDGAPERVDRLELFHRSVEHLQRRDLVDRHEPSRPALVRTELVEDAILRHLEEPRRELAAKRELREALEDAEEHLLREILGERAVLDEPQHVVVDRRLVHPDDDREGSLITPLSFAEDRQIRLRERQGRVSIASCSFARRPRKPGITALLPGKFPS
jgi:hypothetical protein